MALNIHDYISLVEQDDYQRRKAERTIRHQAQQGRKMVKCGACNGSGYYDDTGSPPCGACGGTGKVREKPPQETSVPDAQSKREQLQAKPALNRLRRERGR